MRVDLIEVVAERLVEQLPQRSEPIYTIRISAAGPGGAHLGIEGPDGAEVACWEGWPSEAAAVAGVLQMMGFAPPDWVSTRSSLRARDEKFESRRRIEQEAREHRQREERRQQEEEKAEVEARRRQEEDSERRDPLASLQHLLERRRRKPSRSAITHIPAKENPPCAIVQSGRPIGANGSRKARPRDRDRRAARSTFRRQWAAQSDVRRILGGYPDREHEIRTLAG